MKNANGRRDVMKAIVLVAVDAGKVNEPNGMGVTVFQFIDRDVAVRKLAEAMDGSSCYSVSVVDAGVLVPACKMWMGSDREPGVIVYDELSRAIGEWVNAVAKELEVEGDGE